MIVKPDEISASSAPSTSPLKHCDIKLAQLTTLSSAFVFARSAAYRSAMLGIMPGIDATLQQARPSTSKTFNKQDARSPPVGLEDGAWRLLPGHGGDCGPSPPHRGGEGTKRQV
jgi:hypothetical protein